MVLDLGGSRQARGVSASPRAQCRALSLGLTLAVYCAGIRLISPTNQPYSTGTDSSIPPLCSTCFVFYGLASAAVDTELHARLGSRTGIHFIRLLSKLAAESPPK